MWTTGSSEILYPSTKLQSVTSQKTVVSNVSFCSVCLFGSDVRCVHFASSHKALIQPVEFLYAGILYFCIRPIYNSLTDSCVSTVTKYGRPMNRSSIFGAGEEILLFIPWPHRFRHHPGSCGPLLWGKASTVSSEPIPSNAEVKRARSYAYFFKASWFVKYWGDCTFPFMLRKHSSLLMYCVELVAVDDI
jgi:hypothetical protein